MFHSHVLFALCWAMGISSIAASLVPLNSNLHTRNAPNTPSPGTIRALRRALSSAAAANGDTEYKNSTSLDKSWDGAVLFSLAGEVQSGNVDIAASVEIVCTTCYIKGTASAQFTIAENFDFGEAFKNLTTEIGTEVSNVTDTVIDYIGDYVKNATANVLEDGSQLDDLNFPPIDVDFDIDIPQIPECNLQFQFDDLELYMQLDTSLSGGATYTLNLYTSQTPIGFAVGRDLLVGVVFSVDLILSVEAEIEISSGFHIQLNDGIAIDIPMFDHNVSSINLNGGIFEFLPVTIQGAGTVLTALLRVGIRAGLEISTDNFRIGAISVGFSTGIEAGVFADVAKLVTNVTAEPDSSECKLRVVEEYSMLLGANAGATLSVGGHSWGPAPSTQIPIWYTTMLDGCAASKTTTVATGPVETGAAVDARDDLTTTTTTTEATHTAIVCLSTGLVNCPVSLQSTVKNTVTKTLVTAVPSGSDAVFPDTVRNVVISAIAFGKNMQKITATSGSPVSFVPTVSPTSIITEVLGGETRGVSNKVIIGVSVGVGVPVLIAIIAACIYFCRRKRYSPVQGPEPAPFGKQYFDTPESNISRFDIPRKNLPGVVTTVPAEDRWRS